MATGQTLAARRRAWHEAHAEEAEASGRRFAAEFHLGRLLDGKLQDARLRLRRALARTRLGRRDEARADLAQAGATGEDSLRADVYAELGDWKETAAALARAAGEKPANASTPGKLALLYSRLGDDEAARKAGAELFRRFGDGRADAAALQATWVCVLLADAVEAKTVLRQAERMAQANPGRYPTARTLGAALCRAGRPDEAIERLKEAVALQEDAPSAWLFLALVYRDRKQPDEAKPWLEKAVKWLEKNGPSVPWPQRLELELLRRQAEAGGS